MKRSFTDSLKEPRAQILRNVAIFVLGDPLQTASKGPGSDSAAFDYFRIKRFFAEPQRAPDPDMVEFGYISLYGRIWLYQL